MPGNGRQVGGEERGQLQGRVGGATPKKAVLMCCAKGSLRKRA
jgi:hypothetical protein